MASNTAGRHVMESRGGGKFLRGLSARGEEKERKGGSKSIAQKLYLESFVGGELRPRPPKDCKQTLWLLSHRKKVSFLPLSLSRN